MPMQWQNLPFDRFEECNADDLRALTKKAIALTKGHPVRIFRNNIEMPEYFGWFVDVIPNGKVILVLRKGKDDVQIEVDKTIQVQILTIGLEL